MHNSGPLGVLSENGEGAQNYDLVQKRKSWTEHDSQWSEKEQSWHFEKKTVIVILKQIVEDGTQQTWECICHLISRETSLDDIFFYLYLSCNLIIIKY